MKARSQSSSTRTKRSRAGRKSTASGTAWTDAAVLRELESLGDPHVKAKMAYFGVKVPRSHGVSTPLLHKFAKHIGKSQELAEKLWSSGIHEARILATL